MRVATFNVHHCEGRDGVTDPNRIAAVMRATGADVIALQELDLGMSRSGGSNQPAQLASYTGMTIEFHSLFERDGGRYGIGIAVPAAAGSTMLALPRLAREEPRGAVVARWDGVTFIATHLSRSVRARALQTRALATLAARVDPPVVLLGDLNQRASHLGPLREVGLRQAREGWLQAPLARFRRIDHILAGPGLRLSRSRAIRTDASDHPAVVAEIERSR